MKKISQIAGNYYKFKYFVALTIYSTILFNMTTALGQKSGWRNLFDGKTLNGWSSVGGNAEYTIENNCIVGLSKAGTRNSFLKYKSEFSDFVLEMDVLVNDTSLNSGIQFRSHYDASGNNGNGKIFGFQFEIDPTSRHWTGGIYDESRRGWQYPLTLNEQAMGAFHVGKFNHVRIEAIGNIVKTWVNDQPAAYVVDSVDAKGLIALQIHSVSDMEHSGKKVYWKNIRIKTGDIKPKQFPKAVYIINNLNNKLSGDEIAQGVKLLYDGQSAGEWRSLKTDSFPTKDWDFRGGILRVLPPADPTKHGAGGDIITKSKYKYFDFSLEYNISKAGNSGVKYFVDNKNGSSLGLEFQILDDELNEDAKFGRAGNHKSASLYDMIPAKKDARFVNPVGQWNKIRLVVYPDHRIEHYLNGIKVVSYIKNSPQYTELIALSKYSTIPNFAVDDEAFILLQNHGSEVSFRNLKIRVIE